MAENTEPVVLSQEDLQGMNVAVKGMLGKMETYGKDSAEFKSYQEKVENQSKEIKKLEAFNESKVAEINELKSKQTEALDRIKHLETTGHMMSKSMSNDPKEQAVISHKFMNAFFKKGS